MLCGPTCAVAEAGEPGLGCLAALHPGTYAYLKAWCASADPVLRRSSLDRSRRGHAPPPPYAGPAEAASPVVLGTPWAPPAAPSAPPALEHDTPEAAAHRAAIADHIRRVRGVHRCPFLTKRSDCGCGVNDCAAGAGRRGLVTLSDCLACPADGFCAQESAPAPPHDDPPSLYP